MPKIVDLRGQIFGRLTVLKRHESARPGYLSPFWECECICGKFSIVHIANLRESGATKSCGCANKEKVTTHGMSKTPEYVVWGGIKHRCYNPKAKYYHHYGGRGITMCDEWRDSFEAFYRDMGPRPTPEHTIERDDNDLGYSKDNCRWATALEQANNTRRNVYFEFDGEKKTLKAWCHELNLPYTRMYNRIRKGMSFEDAVDNLIKKIHDSH